MTKVTRNWITLPKPSSDWPRLLKGPFQTAKIYLKEIDREDTTTWCVTAFQCIDGNDAFLWCLREEPVACCELQMQAEHFSSALGCAYTESLGHEIDSKVHFQRHKGDCDRHLHNVSFQSKEGWNSTKPWHFLPLKQRDLFSPLHCWYWTKQKTDEICLTYLLKVFFSKSSRFCYQADD